MARLYFLIVCLLAAPTAAALEKEPLERYQARRAALSSKLNDGITVVFAYEEPEGPSATLGFRQNENFYYLTGIAEPGGILVLVPRLTDRSSPHSGKAEKFPREILFLPPRDPKQERWTGPKLGPRDPDVRQRTGFQTVLSQKFFEQELLRLLPAYGVLYTVLPSGHNRGNRSFEHDRSNRLKTLAPFAKIRDAGPEIARLRQVKSKSELALLEKAIDASMEAHREAMQAVRSGIYEYEIAALMKYVFERLGCERPAFAPIVGSGFNSTVLHYNANTRRMQAGDLVVLDVGGEHGGYAADITRTLPVSGKFTRRQREIYEIVLGAQKAAIAAIKPGVTIGRKTRNSIYRIAYDYLDSHGKDRRGEPLGKYFIHGVGHHLGLNVHDPGDVGRPLEPGMVITVEPGIYIPGENLGVRIEDVVLVTKDGARVLTEALPREADAIERAMARQ